MKFYCFFIFLSAFTISSSQNIYDFPLDIQIKLSGSFAELRSNHFHSGIDIKTKGKEGYKIYAIDSGYVSRIQVSAGGYGKAIYITHSNGKTSVYAHLKRFSAKIEKIVKSIQYKNKSYSIAHFPKKNEILIDSRELIGLSGNTGSSSGPHLHYEIRDYKNRPENPLKFKKIRVLDTIAPYLENLFYKRLSLNAKTLSLEDNYNPFKKIKLKKISQNLYISDTLSINGLIGFGIQSEDKMNNSSNVYGLNKIITLLNNKPIFEIKFDKFTFKESRNINAYIDYHNYRKNKFKIQKLFIEGVNPLSMYNRELGNGSLNINSEFSENLYTIQLFDFNDNMTKIIIPIKFIEGGLEVTKINNKPDFQILLNEIFEKKFNTTSLKITENTFYYNSNINISENNFELTIDKDSFPLRKNITIKFSLDRFEDKVKEKLYIAKRKNNGQDLFVSSTIINDSLIAKTQYLGTYFISKDTVAPKVEILNIKPNQWISDRKFLKIKIFDNESGIKKYNGWINNKWILLEYEPKEKILTYNFDDMINTESKNNLKVKIEDNLGNITQKQIVFFRKEEQ
ncbi:MAG: peptidase M23 [Flavobacteriaceae bacterium]|nr:peptidase M23 [Flavobacteriaceae bacterium]|tara:strand:- start:33645 stop:35345 length:1701 start_codon:yes stop_codon:yes gene_type:complete